MQTTLLPKRVCMEIEKLIMKFIWGNSFDGRHVHLVDWNTLCKPKADGGTCFKHLEDQNAAFLMKLTFGLVAQPDRFWVRVLRSKYMCDGVIPNIVMRCNKSHLWKGICSVWDEVRSHISWKIGNGDDIDFWTDRWVGEIGCLKDWVLPNILLLDGSIPLSSMVNEFGELKWDVFQHLLPLPIVMRIAAIIPPCASVPCDCFRWDVSSDKKFLVRSAYRIKIQQSESQADPI
ncbi:hypothetical protein like AT4G29090 [Hibiscus trionum]|uniref:Reverse transcriptase zinc-binding domain-containing protein n=1 Tax=Hibiscus trionum TaxID=183268 RepID=A0A9W7JHF5_HIBTR|nr:hypothetical protein like AT4G29090 [Hibiscus trionum]